MIILCALYFALVVRLQYTFVFQEDYKLLEAMNLATITKYSDMKQIAGNIARNMSDLNEKCKLRNISLH